MKRQLVESNTARLEAIERGEQIVVGVNKYLETEPSPLTGGAEAIMTVSEEAERGQIERLKAWRAARDAARGRRGAGGAQARGGQRAATSCRPRSPAPRPASPPANGAGRCARRSANTARRPASAAPCATTSSGLDDIRAEVDRVSRKLGRRLDLPGRQARPRRPFQRRRADRGARARRRHAGGLRRHPPDAGGDRRGGARAEGACASGCRSCRAATCRWSRTWSARMREAGLDDVPVVVGGIIPPEDAEALGAGRRRRGLYAEGFRAQPHHVRPGAHRRTRRTARRTANSPTRFLTSVTVAPCARNSRKPVACVDFDSFLPSASRISRW